MNHLRKRIALNLFHKRVHMRWHYAACEQVVPFSIEVQKRPFPALSHLGIFEQAPPATSIEGFVDFLQPARYRKIVELRNCRAGECVGKSENNVLDDTV